MTDRRERDLAGPTGRTGQLEEHLLGAQPLGCVDRFAVDAPSRLQGTQQVFLQLTGPTGWNRRLALSPLRHFTGAAISTPATIDLRAVQALLTDVQKATGIPAVGASVGIVMKVHVTGTVAGQAVDESFSPTAGFQLQPLELTPSGSAPPPAAGSAAAGTPSTRPALIRARRER